MAKKQALLPHSVEVEQAFLGSILIEPSLILWAAHLVRPADCFIERHGLIYQAMLDLHQVGTPIDLVTLGDTLGRRLDEIGGQPYLAELLTATPTSMHMEYYARLVRTYARLRRLIAGAGTIARLAHVEGDPVPALAQAEAVLLTLVREIRSYGAARPVKDILKKYLDRVQGQPLRLGLSTGLAGLDNLCGRLQPADLILLAGRPGTLKTSLALKIARSVDRAGRRVVFFSLGTSDQQLVQRLIVSETGLSPQRLRLGDIEPATLPDFSRTNFFIDDTPGLLVQELRWKAKQLHAEIGLDLIIVDYLQLMRTSQQMGSRVLEIAAIGRALRALAKELDLPIMVISRLAPGDGQRPVLADLREECGSLEYEADLVWLCYLASLDLEIIQARWRDGPEGVVRLRCDPARQEFYEETYD